MTDPAELRRRLNSARELLAPSAEQRERVRRGLAARPDFRAPTQHPARAMAGPHASRADGSNHEQSSSRDGAAKGSQALAFAKSGVLLAAGFALGHWVAASRAPEQALPVSSVSTSLAPVAGASSAEPQVSAGNAPAVPASATASNAPREADASGESPARDSAARRAHARPPPATSASAEELRLLQRAERAIRSGNGALAHSFIQELDARFPKTIWREERDAILVLAACTLDEPGAPERARAFLERRPGSMYHDRIASVCGLGHDTRLDTSPADGSPPLGHSSLRRKIP